MSKNHPREISAEHQEISGLLPWYVNGTLDDLSRQRVAAHAAVCPVCHDDLSLEQKIFAKIDGETAIDYVPVASLKRLHAQLDALQSRGAAAHAPVLQSRHQAHWRLLAAASIAALTLVIGVLLMDRSGRFQGPAQAAYRTVTSPTTRPRDEVIRAVFAPSITLVELQAILDEAQLKIVSGPSEAGVYSLAANADRPVRSSLALLRRHSTVRFAEATRELESDRSP